MSAAPSVITCGSCGAQYDGTGMKSGVQFQCPQCQSMVVVGAPAKPALPGKRSGGGPLKPAQRAASGRAAKRGQQPGSQEGEQPGYGMQPAAPKNNSMMIFGIIIGVIVVGLIAVVIVMTTSKDAEARAAKEAEEKREKEEKARQEKKNVEVSKESEERTRTINAGTEAGGRIAQLLQAKDMNTLSSMFNWDIVQKDFCQQLEKQSKEPPMKDGQPELDKAGKPKASNYQKFLNDPIYCEGDWEKREDGRFSGLYVGRVPRGSDALRQRLMWYIENCYAGADAFLDTEYMEKASAKNQDKFSMTIDGKLYLGRVCMIKSKAAGKNLNFCVGATQGDVNVRILRFDDPQRIENVKQLEAKFQRKDEPERDERDFINPDRDPSKKPERDPGVAPEGPDNTLPEAVKTGATCPQDLVNVFRELAAGKKITNPQIKVLQDQSRSRADRKAFIGALLDVLIDRFKEGKRLECDAISHALFAVWGNACGYTEADCTYSADGNFDAGNDFPLRVWAEFYKNYKT